MRTTVVFDVGETLVDETSMWRSWAGWLDVPELTLYGVLGGLAARGEDHRRFVELLRPGATFDAERAAKEAAGQGWADQDIELYPDAVACLHAVKADGWRVVVGGNQPAAIQALVQQLDLPVQVRRGPWGVLHADDPAVDLQVGSLAELPALLRTLR